MLFLFLLWVLLDRGRLNRVVTGVTPLHTVTNVDGRALAALCDSDSTRPSERPDHVDCVADGLSFATLRVLMGVADNLADPAGLLTFEQLVLFETSESLNSRVLGLQLFLSSSKIIFRNVGSHVGCATSLENNSMNVTPGTEGLKLVGLGELEFLIELGKLGRVRIFFHNKETLRADSSSVEDSGKGCAQKVSFLSNESRVGVNSSV